MLQELLYKIAIKSFKGSTNLSVTSLHTDSRKVMPGSCFVAIKGYASDGHDYIDAAIKNGAIAVVCQNMPTSLEAEGVT